MAARVLGRAARTRRDGNCETGGGTTVIGWLARPARPGRPCDVPSDAKRPVRRTCADEQEWTVFPSESEGRAQVVQRVVDTNRPASTSP